MQSKRMKNYALPYLEDKVFLKRPVLFPLEITTTEDTADLPGFLKELSTELQNKCFVAKTEEEL
ncbi:MAG: hypothetical protein GF401_08705 [Chitinivibrionales bacterium]|nr:hypothetical protein [Chitinivibrionales bacterium]